MAELCGLLQDLGERIACKNVAFFASPSSSSPLQHDLDPLETRFRSVLPTLLRSYVSLSSLGKEREIVAILKLLTHTARNYPGVFFNGKPSHTLPILGRILPILAEQAFVCHHGVIFEAASSLLSLLRSGDREVFRQFFMDSMLVIEDLRSMASFYSEKSGTRSAASISLKCFSESFSAIGSGADLFCEIPESYKPVDGPGIVVDVTDKPRWQSFASWIIKIINKCLIDGTLHVEGLISSSFMFTACSLISYGDAPLHMACFDFARIATTVLDGEIVPSEELILSILYILAQDESKISVSRNTEYDSCMGTCLHALYSGCQIDVIQSTAKDLADVFFLALQHTESHDLKVALCSAYKNLINICPSHIWRPEHLLMLLCLRKPCLPLVDCIEKAIGVLGISNVGVEKLGSGCHILSLDPCCKKFRTSSPGEKETAQITEGVNRKRRKVGRDNNVTGNDTRKDSPTESLFKDSFPFRSKLPKESYGDYFQQMLFGFVELLKPHGYVSEFVSPENALVTLGMLSNALCNYSVGKLSILMFQQVQAWIPLICDQAMKKNLITFDLSLYLEAVHNILVLQCCKSVETGHFKNAHDEYGVDENFQNLFKNVDGVLSIILLPWNHQISDNQFYALPQTKSFSIQILSKLGIQMKVEDLLSTLDIALSDESEEVRNEAIMCMPVMFFSISEVVSYAIRRFGNLAMSMSDQGKQLMVHCIGYLSCLCGHLEDICGVEDSCKLYIDVSKMKLSKTADILMRGFFCPVCDKENEYNKGDFIKMLFLCHSSKNHQVLNFDFDCLRELFLKFLLDGSCDGVELACVEVLPRILMHASEGWLTKTSSLWSHCIDYLLLHKKNAVRQAFCLNIHWFLNSRVLSSLFMDGDACGKPKEQMFLDKIKHSLATSEDPLILETLLQATSRILVAVDIPEPLFFFSLVLLIDQLDSKHIVVRVTSSRLIKRTCHVYFKGDINVLFSKFSNIRDGIFEYLCGRLVNRPALTKEFAETVMSIETVDLIRKMVPIVLPKLVVSQQDNNEALHILHELANHLNTELPLLLLEWCHKVLAYVLLQADGKELVSALQFYEMQSGSDTGEIFVAVLPALLDELVRFLGETNSDETGRRIARVPQMLKEVARIVTGSDDLPGFLRAHFVGLLNSIDRKMLRGEEIMLQKQAVKCIQKLIEMIGVHLGTYVPKILVLLMHVIEKEPLQNEGLEVWHFFIKQLSKVSPSNLRHVASQVFAALIPCLERYKENPSLHLDKVVNIFEELVVENKKLLAQNIRELPLLPSIPVLAKVNEVIEEARGSMSLRDHLQHAVDGLNHESLNVRYMVACELSKFLIAKREDVTDLILGESRVDLGVLSSLIASLLKGCAEESRTQVGQRLKLVSADCLGAVGAIDPAKFKGTFSPRFKIECSDDDLIFELIHEHLTRVFRAASDTIVQDSAALAIQELLKLSGCQASLDESGLSSTSQPPKGRGSQEISSKRCPSDNHDEISERGRRLWARFSNYVKEIIAPCLTSKFQLQSVTDSIASGSIYRPSMSFRRWIYSWIRKLTLQATGPRASIFGACRGIVRHDMGTALYLLPYLVLNALCHGSAEVRQGITEEILSVLNAAALESSGTTVHGGNGGQRDVCIQAIFTLLDNLGQWVDDQKHEVALSQSVRQPPKTNHQIVGPSVPDLDQMNAQFNNVLELVAAIPKLTLARTSFHCQAYARALLYYESHVREKSGSFNPAAEKSGFFSDDDISFFMEIYSGLDEPDGLFGLANLRKSSCLDDQLLINEKVGNWAEALTCCEQTLQTEPSSAPRHSGVLNCLLNMCHLQAMITYVDGLIFRLPQYKKTWCMQGVQAAWRLQRWDLMDEYLAGAEKEGAICSCSESSALFEMGLAKIFQALMKKDQYLVSERIAQSKQALLAPLAAAGMESYARAYPFVVKLHMLRELEDFHNLLNEESFLERSFNLDHLEFSKLVTEWENRLNYTQPSLWAREPLLALRRMVFGVNTLGSEVGKCWLQYAKLCRSAGHYETASHAILEAESSGAPNVHIEKSKLFWCTRRTDRAVAELQQALLNMPVETLGAAATASITNLSLLPPNMPSILSSQPSKESEDAARTILLYTRWIHSTGQKQKEDVISLYSRVRELQPKWEKGYFFMAKYYDDLLVDARKRQEESHELKDGQSVSRIISVASAGTLHPKLDEKPWWSYIPDVLLFYAKGLHRGHKHLFQALPRLLTLWFEFGSKYHRENLSSNKAFKTVNARVMSIMRGCLKDLPTYQWLTALSQLVSRICHQNEEVVRLVKHIITTVLQEYPQQALWIMAGVSRSTVSARREAAAEIIQSARKGSRHGSDRNRLFIEFASLIDQLIKLCFHGGQPKARTINIAVEFSALKRAMPVGVIMPVQQALTVNLPVHGFSRNDLHEFDPFSASNHATISGISDEAEILSSLQKPKKVIFHGSDGISYPFLCKPKDDLRKDARMMEFTAMINHLLSKYPESRRRKLYIRTFAVIPLTEDCGMVEWVPHTRGLRHILQDIYVACGKFDRQRTNPLIKKMYDQFQGKIPADELLMTKILPLFPPVFHKWFLNTFSEPGAWFRARTAYAHTAAVWSMIGHTVGLGDRHGENILFDSTTGDCVHVDFSCLFDKGLLLEKPELVPFRLTQNMIDGLGISGYEGVFLRTCEITLSVLRTHRETLMSVLETFVHDPLVEWTKSHKSSGVEVENPHAQRAMSNIEGRLRGVVVGVGATPSLPLAVEGQAQRLIAEAVSHKNLGEMYIWWMPWF